MPSIGGNDDEITAEDLSCLKDPDPDDEVAAATAGGQEHDANGKQEPSEDIKENKDKGRHRDNSAFPRVDNSAAEKAAVPGPASTPSKKHARPTSPWTLFERHPHSAGPIGGDLQQPLAGGLTLIHDGSPQESIPGGWPTGWRQRIVFRKTGGRKGPRKDNYFYTPVKGYELLGIKKAKLFLQKLKECGGDEEKALESMTSPVV